jgi:hypothetical protein
MNTFQRGRKSVKYYKQKTIYFLIIVFLVVAISSSPVSAQVGLEITPFYGYQFGGYLPTYKGKLDISNDDNFGVIIDIETASLQRGTYLELSYSRQDGRLTYKDGLTNEIKVQFDLAIEYYQIGGLFEQDLSGKSFKGFGMFSLGVSRWAPKESKYNDEWIFSATLGLGLKAFLTPRFGLRFQGRMLIPMYFSGGGMWCGTGGCNVGVGSTSVILQADVSAGLIIRL